MSVAVTEGTTVPSRGGETRGIWLPWTFRRILALPGSPLAIGAGAALLFLVLDTVWLNFMGIWQGIRFEGRLFFLHPVAAGEIIYALYFGLAPTALLHLFRGADRDLAALRPVLGLDAQAFAEARRRVLCISARTLRAGTAVALAIAAFDLWVFLALLDQDVFIIPGTTAMAWVVIREVVVDLLVFRVLTWGVFVAVHLSRLGQEHARIRLVDVRELQPFTQNGVRLAFFWLVIWAISVPLLFVTPLGENAVLALGLLVGIGIALSVTAIAIPTLGPRRRIRAAKQRELDAVRRAIERDRLDALDAQRPESAAAAARLPGLIAYEARIAGVSEWLLDARAFGRVGLYLLIPVASWVGSALVERVVDTLLE